LGYFYDRDQGSERDNFIVVLAQTFRRENRPKGLWSFTVHILRLPELASVWGALKIFSS
jgi:hypothetical protein